MSADKTSDKYEDVFEDGESGKQTQTVHRIRANSTIMQLNKILVANRGEIPIRIFRTAHELSLHTIAIFSYEDRLSMHRQSMRLIY
jgi:pyruvate carboxylase